MLSQIYRLLFSWSIVFILLAARVFLVIQVESLSIDSVEVPAAVMNSSQVTLVCNYSLQNEQLYSVKWYKNYVEFYRFQPIQADNSGLQSQADHQQQHSKQEFELDGISLNISKSNATHVFLKQATLNSEGTYKCEVSADSPSFATVSIERKMKVYILSKQKLSIVDNNHATNQHNFHQPQQPNKQANTYRINDTVNVTCISAHSHPSAKLTWFINDSPVINSSRWLTHHSPSKLALNQPQPQAQQQQYLTETRLTLSFKIQPSHLSRDNSLQSYQSMQQRSQFLRLRCLAMLSVEFYSDTVISVLSGKKTVNKKNRSSQIAARVQLDKQEAAFSSYMSRLSVLPRSMAEEQEEKLKATINSQRIHVGNRISVSNSSDLEYYEYKWPQPIDNPHRLPSERRNGFTNAWITSPVTTATALTLPSTSIEDSELITDISSGNRINNNRALMRQSSSMASLTPISWTNKQIKSQSEFIDQMLKITHANELDTPTIEARLIQEPSDSLDDVEEIRPRNSSPDADINSASMSEDTFTGEPEARTTFNQPPTSDLPSIPSLDDQNYELNNLVQFTCNPRITLSDRSDVRKKVFSKWFINNKEINAKQINSFDGSKFYHTHDVQLDGSHSSVRQNSTSYSNKGLKSYQAECIALNIEFTPSLFQIKELDLKCRTIVEQPLIEFEQHLAIYVPFAISSNQDQFVQTVDQKEKNNRNQSSSNNRQNKRRDRNRDGLAQLLPSSSAFRLSSIDDLKFRPIIILVLSLAFTNCFSLNFSNTMRVYNTT